MLGWLFFFVKLKKLKDFDPANSLEKKEKGNDLQEWWNIFFFWKKMIHFVWHGLICEISSSLASEVSFGRGDGRKTFIAVVATIYH